MRIEKNRNIDVYYSENEKVFEIIPGNRELNINYVKYWVKNIMKHIDEKEEDDINYIIKVHGYAIDGLFETNYRLLSDSLAAKNFVLIKNCYTNEYRRIK